MLRSALIYIISGWSGFFVMSLELLSGKLLSSYFGSNIFVWGGIISVFMISLAIGYLQGGRLSFSHVSLKTLSHILCVSALLAFPIIIIGKPFLNWLSFTISDPRYGSLMGSIVLFSATIITAGMISPYAIRLLITKLESSGQSAGLLYFFSTIGSALGTILTSFYFVLWMEINHIILSLIIITLLLSLSTLMIDKYKLHSY